MSQITVVHSHLLLRNIPVCDYTQLLHSTVNEDLSCFQFGATMNKAVLNSFIHAHSALEIGYSFIVSGLCFQRFRRKIKRNLLQQAVLKT